MIWRNIFSVRVNFWIFPQCGERISCFSALWAVQIYVCIVDIPKFYLARKFREIIFFCKKNSEFIWRKKIVSLNFSFFHTALWLCNLQNSVKSSFYADTLVEIQTNWFHEKFSSENGFSFYCCTYKIRKFEKPNFRSI